jgi:putative tryptophan/tyrosine transport system substrate-binding protein
MSRTFAAASLQVVHLPEVELSASGPRPDDPTLGAGPSRRSHPMTSRRAFLAGAASLLAPPLAAEAQPAGKIYRIGWLSNNRYPAGDDAFQRGLRDLGWVEGRNVITEYRFAQGEPMQLELVGLKVDLIVAIAGPALVAKDATSTIPIVFVVYADPVRLGLVTSLARPGGNLTGLTSIGTELIAKRLQLLKDAVPRLSRVAVLVNPFRPWANLETARAHAAAQSLGLHLQRVEVGDPTKFERAFSDMAKDRATALVVDNDTRSTGWLKPSSETRRG